VTKPWYRKDHALFEEIRRQVEETYPDLKFNERDQSLVLSGYYPLFEGDRVYDRYLIELVVPPESPLGLPVVREVAGRIPRVPDRHMESDGAACIVLPDAFWYEFPRGMSLIDFLNGPMRVFFGCQTLIESGVKNPWPAGEWAHWADGNIQFYAPLIKSQQPEVVLGYLEILKAEKTRGHWLCPCGSGQRLRKCHLALVEELRSKIPRAVAAKSWERMAEYLKRLATVGQARNDIKNSY